MKFTRVVGFGAVVLAGCAVCNAGPATLLVDFGSASSFRGVSVPAPDALGHYWNSLQPGAFTTDLRDINNVPTTIDLGFDTPVGTDSYNGPAGVTSFPPTAAEIAATDVDFAALGNLGVREAVIDFAASPGGDNRCRFQIQGLDLTQKYTLTIFGSHKYSNDATTIYTVYGDVDYTSVLGTASLEVMNPEAPDQHNRDKVATISGLVPSEGSILYVEFVGSTGDIGYLNDFQLTTTVSMPALPGDYNDDGVVNAADYTVWADHFGQTGSGTPGDGNGDNVVNAADYTVWADNFGNSNPTAPPPGGVVPEPSALALCALPIAGLARRRRA